MNNLHNKITKQAYINYSNSLPWPEKDIWHDYTYHSIKKIVEEWLQEYSTPEMLILNAGSGGTEYATKATIIHLDIIDEYISHFSNYIVGSIEDIALSDASVNGIICVGSVINYADVQRVISEFYRLLKPNGFLILEFERSNSAEFLFTQEYGKYIFPKEYYYNNQRHLLWMYNENHICHILNQYHIKIDTIKRIHVLSSLLYRLGFNEEKATPFSKFDRVCKIISYPLAHNTILLARK